MRAPPALLPLGFIACAAPRQQQPSGETVSKHFQKCVQGLAAEEATAGPSRKRRARASPPRRLRPGQCRGRCSPLLGHDPAPCVPRRDALRRCWAAAPGARGGAAVGRRLLPSSRAFCRRGKLALAIPVPRPVLWDRGRILSQADLWPGPLRTCFAFTSLIPHLWYKTSFNFYTSAENAGQEHDWLLPDNSL